MLLVAGFNDPTFGQATAKTFSFEGAIGISSFDEKFNFVSSPYLGLGAGYNISDLLQLNLALAFTPTQQRLSTATETVTARFSVVQYHLDLSFTKPKPLFWRLHPFAKIGVGAVRIDPHPVSLNTGGTIMQFEAPVDHNPAIFLSAGIDIRLLKRLHLGVQYGHSFMRTDFSDGLQSETATAQDRSLTLNVSTFLKN